MYCTLYSMMKCLYQMDLWYFLKYFLLYYLFPFEESGGINCSKGFSFLKLES